MNSIYIVTFWLQVLVISSGTFFRNSECEPFIFIYSFLFKDIIVRYSRIIGFATMLSVKGDAKYNETYIFIWFFSFLNCLRYNFVLLSWNFFKYFRKLLKKRSCAYVIILLLNTYCLSLSLSLVYVRVSFLRYGFSNI